MNRRRRPFAVLLQLAFLATLLMALAPLLSRWQQAQGAPVMLMPGGMSHVMAAQAADTEPTAPPGNSPAGSAHHGMHDPTMHDPAMHHTKMHHTKMQGTPPHALSEHAEASVATAPVPPIDPHAGHGEACEYCMMASRLMPWLAVLILLLPALPVVAPAVLRSVTTPRTLRWPAHGARGPPLHA